MMKFVTYRLSFLTWSFKKFQNLMLLQLSSIWKLKLWRCGTDTNYWRENSGNSIFFPDVQVRLSLFEMVTHLTWNTQQNANKIHFCIVWLFLWLNFSEMEIKLRSLENKSIWQTLVEFLIYDHVIFHVLVIWFLMMVIFLMTMLCILHVQVLQR